MQNLPHSYIAKAIGEPLGTITTYSGGLEKLHIAAPKEFDGPGDKWSPEELLIASVADCLILTFRAIAKASKLEWTNLTCEVNGTLDRIDKINKFTEIHIKASLQINSQSDKEKALRLLEKSEQSCLITNSLNAQIYLETSIGFV
jgi:peroxiredoxin-like protein